MTQRCLEDILADYHGVAGHPFQQGGVHRDGQRQQGVQGQRALWLPEHHPQRQEHRAVGGNHQVRRIAAGHPILGEIYRNIYRCLF